MARTEASPAAAAMDTFNIDDYNPFMHDPCTAKGLLTEAHGLSKVLAIAFADSQQAMGKGVESDLNSLNGNFIASALNGVGSLIAMALFLQEQNS